MRIASVRAVRTGQFLFARVETACGRVGWGESGAWGQLDASAAALTPFAAYLTGEDPRHIERHWQVMQRFAHFRGTAICGAVSAIDIALWDILGQHHGCPIHELLGGAVRDRLRLYGHVYAPTIEGVLADLRRLKAAGFTAVGHLNPFLDEAEGDRWFQPQVRKLGQAADYVRQFRDAVGDEMDLLLELHRRLNPAEAIQFAGMVEPYRPMWLEDPIRPEFVAEMADLARRLPIPIATGERFFGPVEFAQLMRQGPIGFARTSLAVCGGITGGRKVAAIAEAMDVPIAPHCPLSPIALFAGLHVGAAVANFAIQEYPTGFHNLSLVSDGKLLGADLVTAVPTVVGGFAQLPTAPGLGTAVDEAAAARTPPITRRVSMRQHLDGSPIDQ
jgi:galactonate dehydratase